MIQWYEQIPRTKTFVKANFPLDEIDDASVILWEFASNRNETSFDIEIVNQKRIRKLYEEHDSFVES